MICFPVEPLKGYIVTHDRIIVNLGIWLKIFRALPNMNHGFNSSNTQCIYLLYRSWKRQVDLIFSKKSTGMM
jgi:hypothetical protein